MMELMLCWGRHDMTEYGDGAQIKLGTMSTQTADTDGDAIKEKEFQPSFIHYPNFT